MSEHRRCYPIFLMARVLEVSRSGYYWWLRREPTARDLRHEILKPLILQAHLVGRKTYGSKRIQSQLAIEGTDVGRDQISKLRRELELKCIQKAKFIATTNSNHDLPVAPNLLAQNFETTAPGTVWGSDITYIPTGEGWLFLAGIKDFHTREIVGYAMDSRMTKELVRTALRKALAYRKPAAGCIAHSDRGSQYCSLDYQDDLRAAGLTTSMSRRGNCYDNAPTESLWSSLKLELIYQRKFETRLQAESAIKEYIEVFYNRIRLHSSLGNIPPAIFAERSTTERKSA
jgi:putative transposase